MDDQHSADAPDDQATDSPRPYLATWPGRIWLGLTAFYLVGLGVRNAPQGLPTTAGGWLSGLMDLGFAVLTTYVLVSVCVNLPLTLWRWARARRAGRIAGNHDRSISSLGIRDLAKRRTLRVAAVIGILLVAGGPFALSAPQWVPYGKCAQATAQVKTSEAEGLRIWRQYRAVMTDRGASPTSGAAKFQNLDSIAANLVIQVLDQDEIVYRAVLADPACFDSRAQKLATAGLASIDASKASIDSSGKDLENYYVLYSYYDKYYSILDGAEMS